jgi:3-oxoadipate enol-lactonase
MTALHHRVDGPAHGSVLVLGGSLGSDLTMWDGQLALAADRRLVRFDHRGHGGTPPTSGPYTVEELGHDVLELIDGLGLDRVSYAGLSLGGMIGMWLAANAPERIDRLVLLCTTAFMPTGDLYRERAVAVRSAGAVEPIADGVLARWLTPAFADANPDIRASLRAMLTATSATGYAGCCDAIAAMDLRSSLPSVLAPTLVISGAEDPATPVALQAEIAAAIPGARHEIVRPAAHLATTEQPERINELIGAHLS